MRTQSPFLQHLRWPSSPSPTHFFQSVDQHSSHLQSSRPPPPPPFTLYTSQRSCFPVTPLHSRQPRYQGRDTIVRSLGKTFQLGCIFRWDMCKPLDADIARPQLDYDAPPSDERRLPCVETRGGVSVSCARRARGYRYA